MSFDHFDVETQKNSELRDQLLGAAENGQKTCQTQGTAAIQTDGFKATYIDMIIATIITFGLPFLCHILEQAIGPLVPLLLYYACCIFVVYARRRTLNYSIPTHNKHRWVCTLFVPLLLIIAAQQVMVYDLVVPAEHHAHDWLLTLFLWCPINAALEQLLWVYIYDAFACFDTTKCTTDDNIRKICQYALHGLGLIASLSFVGMIHGLFWVAFLMEFDDSKTVEYRIFLAIKFLTIFGYIAIFEITNSAVPLFALHIITDCNSVIAAKYSILPYLF